MTNRLLGGRRGNAFFIPSAGKKGIVYTQTSTINREISGLPPGFVTLVIVDPANYLSATLELLKYLTNKRKALGIYVTVNRPYKNLVNTLESNRIDASKIFFIDCITKSVGGEPQREENCVFLASPKNLTELGVIVEGAIRAVGSGENCFVFLDSFSALSIYHSAEAMSQFGHFLSGRMRVHGIGGIFLSTEDEASQKAVRTITQFCDRVITVT